MVGCWLLILLVLVVVVDAVDVVVDAVVVVVVVAAAELNLSKAQNVFCLRANTGKEQQRPVHGKGATPQDRLLDVHEYQHDYQQAVPLLLCAMKVSRDWNKVVPAHIAMLHVQIEELCLVEEKLGETGEVQKTSASESDDVLFQRLCAIMSEQDGLTGDKNAKGEEEIHSAQQEVVHRQAFPNKIREHHHHRMHLSFAPTSWN